MSEKDEVAIRIKLLREAANWTQSQLGREAGVSPSAINMIESGSRRPSLIVLRKLCAALKVSTDELTGSVSVSEVSERAQAFYREFQSLENLDPEDRDIILGLAEKLKKRTE